jgi:hypothetical protein
MINSFNDEEAFKIATADYYIKRKTLTFSQRGSINVNKSLLLAFDFNTSAPPAFPKMISPAFFDALMATERSESSVSCEGSSMLLDDILMEVVDDTAAARCDFKLENL